MLLSWYLGLATKDFGMDGLGKAHRIGAYGSSLVQPITPR